MSAKSDTQLPSFIWNEMQIFWIASNNFSSSDHYISGRLIEKVEEIKKNIKTWVCGTSRFQVMSLGKGVTNFYFLLDKYFVKNSYTIL